jgi:hypothetical protein
LFFIEKKTKKKIIHQKIKIISIYLFILKIICCITLQIHN